jgi:hypothetical protein
MLIRLRDFDVPGTPDPPWRVGDSHGTIYPLA